MITINLYIIIKEKNIKSIRDELGLKQYELANALDLSLCVIKRAE